MLKRQDNILYKRGKATKKRLQNQGDRKGTGEVKIVTGAKRTKDNTSNP